MKNLTKKEDWSKFWKSKVILFCMAYKGDLGSKKLYYIIPFVLHDIFLESLIIEFRKFASFFSVLFKKYFNFNSANIVLFNSRLFSPFLI